MFCLVQFTIYGIFEMQWFIPHGLSRNAQTHRKHLNITGSLRVGVEGRTLYGGDTSKVTGGLGAGGTGECL